MVRLADRTIIIIWIVVLVAFVVGMLTVLEYKRIETQRCESMSYFEDGSILCARRIYE